MAYIKALIQTDLYMEILHKIETTEGNTCDYVLKLLVNIYGQKQAGRIIDWFYTISHQWMCHLQGQNVEDGIFLSTSNDQLTHIIKELMITGLQIKDQGHPADYVGVNINGSYKFSQ
ncbi:hypothetical protein ACHAW6_008322 [Cyclotella cf. meneghiniana]